MFEVFAVTDAKTRNAKIPQNFGLVKLTVTLFEVKSNFLN